MYALCLSSLSSHCAIFSCCCLFGIHALQWFVEHDTIRYKVMMMTTQVILLIVFYMFESNFRPKSDTT